MSITAIIPVREGSGKLKNKNVAPFAGINLSIHKINQLKRVSKVDNIVVTSDSNMMLEMAKSEGAQIIKRAPEFCDEKTRTFGEVVAHVCEYVLGDNILWATCTSPLVSPSHYTTAIELYFDALVKGFGMKSNILDRTLFGDYKLNPEEPFSNTEGLINVGRLTSSRISFIDRSVTGLVC